ncbi:MAG: terminase small subunit-like protein [Gemmatimonadaceae bacterium]
MGGIGSGPQSRTYTLEDGLRAVQAMREGALSLRQACHKAGITKGVFFSLKDEYPELADAYAKARPIAAVGYAERSVRAVERAWTTVLDENVDAKRANAVASAGRSLSDRYAWIAGRIDPDAWGEKVTHAGTIRHEAVVLLPQLQALTPPLAATPDTPGALPRVSARMLGDGGSDGDEGA